MTQTVRNIRFLLFVWGGMEQRAVPRDSDGAGEDARPPETPEGRHTPTPLRLRCRTPVWAVFRGHLYVCGIAVKGERIP